MPSVEVQRTIAAPPDRVFRIATDLENLAATVSGIDSVEVLTEGPVGEGSRWRETRTMMGRPATEEMWVTAFEAPRRFVVEAESHGAHYRTEMTFEPESNGTRVTMVFAARPVTFLARLFALFSAVMLRSLRKMIEQDLEDLKQAAESPA